MTFCLAQRDRAIANTLNTGQVSVIFRYVDDYLVLLKDRPTENDTEVTDSIRSTFVEQAQGLKFTHELPANSSLQFLDLRLSFLDHQACWMHSPRSKTMLLQYDSAHSKLIKRGIVRSCLSASLKKSCEHTAGESFNSQIQRLTASGYPNSILFDVAESMITSSGRPTRNTFKGRRPAVAPYIYCITQNLKRAASKFEVQVVMSVHDKLRRLCPKINNQQEQTAECTVKHQHQYVTCNSGVVYEIPFSCGKVYVEQSGRCLNVRLREHALALRSSPAGHLAVHVRDCLCTPLFEHTKVLKRFSGQRSRELFEAQVILSKGDACISAPSVSLSEKEQFYLSLYP